MKTQALALKNRIFASGGTTTGVFGAVGSLHNVCHWLCMGVVSTLAIFGITTNVLPLMFLQTYQVYFWWMAVVFTALALYFYFKQKRHNTRDRNLLFINSGLLIFALPFSQIVDYMDFFRFTGGSLAIFGLFLLLFGKKFQSVYRSVVSVKEPQFRVSEAIPQVVGTTASIQFPKLTIQSTLFAIVIGGFLINQYFMYQMGIFDKMGTQRGSTATSAMKPLSQMKLSPFDVVLAKERMDKNNDGICDTCGMPLQTCIDSGQLDCNMANNSEAIGILGSQHIHADFKAYVNGQALDFAKPDYFMKSSFLHVDNNQNKDDASSVLHMHASNVPLWLFFRSLGMNLTKDSLTLADGIILKNENGNTLKFYVNGKKIDDLGTYVFQDLDKLLISYGPENDPEAENQLNSVTSFSGNH